MIQFEIRKVDNGYITITNNNGLKLERIYKSFDELVQGLAFHFHECGIEEEWVTHAERNDGK